MKDLTLQLRLCNILSKPKSIVPYRKIKVVI